MGLYKKCTAPSFQEAQKSMDIISLASNSILKHPPSPPQQSRDLLLEVFEIAVCQLKTLSKASRTPCHTTAFFVFLSSLPRGCQPGSLSLSIPVRALWPFLYSLPKMASGTSVFDAHDNCLLISYKPSGMWNPAVDLGDQTISFFNYS